MPDGTGPASGACLAAVDAFDYRADVALLRREPPASRLARVYAASGAARWNVSIEAFGAALDASVRHRWPEQRPEEAEITRYLDSLALEDLALACGCRAGDEDAWEHFVREFRPTLYAAARAIAGEPGRELADALYADLFGLGDDRPDRRSLFGYYHGRSRLATWLRAVLARRHVDRLRTVNRLEPLDEAGESGGGGRTSVTMSTPGQADPERTTFVRAAQEALDAALAALRPSDRLRLRLYYGDDLTLAAIGRLLGEHEATVSRKLDRARRELRAAVERLLRKRWRMNDDQIRVCFEHAAEAPELQLTRLLSPEGGS